MRLMRLLFTISLSVVFLTSGWTQYRPERVFREDFKETPAEIPINQDHIVQDDVVLALHGPGKDVIKKSNHEKPVDDPFYVWSGLCEGNWAVSLSHKDYMVDLSKYGKIKWRSKQTGFRQLRLILQLADGSWIISEQSDGPSTDWREVEWNISDIQWWTLDIDKVVEKKPANDVDLSKVVAVGWTDLMRGGGSPASSRLDWIEIYGFPIEK